MVKKNRPDIIFLKETKINASKASSIQKRIGYEGYMLVKSIEMSGSLIMMWRNEAVELKNYS